MGATYAHTHTHTLTREHVVATNLAHTHSHSASLFNVEEEEKCVKQQPSSTGTNTEVSAGKRRRGGEEGMTEGFTWPSWHPSHEVTLMSQFSTSGVN